MGSAAFNKVPSRGFEVDSDTVNSTNVNSSASKSVTSIKQANPNNKNTRASYIPSSSMNGLMKGASGTGGGSSGLIGKSDK